MRAEVFRFLFFVLNQSVGSRRATFPYMQHPIPALISCVKCVSGAAQIRKFLYCSAHLRFYEGKVKFNKNYFLPWNNNFCFINPPFYRGCGARRTAPLIFSEDLPGALIHRRNRESSPDWSTRSRNGTS